MPFFIIKIIVIFLFCSQVYAKNEDKSNKKGTGSKKTYINSEIIDVKRVERKIEFIENVVIQNPDERISANRVILYYNENTNNAVNVDFDGRIKEIIAIGNVRFHNKEIDSKSDFGHYNPYTNILTLEKNVEVKRYGSYAYGEKFDYNLKTKIGNFVGEKKTEQEKKENRVIIIIDSKKNKEIK